MYFILKKHKTDDLKSKTNSRFKKKRPFSNKIEKKSQSNFASTKFQNRKTKNKNED